MILKKIKEKMSGIVKQKKLKPNKSEEEIKDSKNTPKSKTEIDQENEISEQEPKSDKLNTIIRKPTFKERKVNTVKNLL